MADILAAVGKSASRFFADLPNIAAVENIHQEKLNRKGKAGLSQERQYRYLCFTATGYWGPFADEYRSDIHGKATIQMAPPEGIMLTAGFVSSPLVFHPAYQSGSSFRLLGRQKVKGRDTLLVAYAQHPARSRISGSFQIGKTARSTYSQGIAWLDSENYHIIRLISDLLTPMPQFKLERRSAEIDFSEVHFHRVAGSFWLPTEVTVTLDWNGSVLRNKHVYSDFRVFNVDATQRVGNPKDSGRVVEETEDPAPPGKLLETDSGSLGPPAIKP